MKHQGEGHRPRRKQAVELKGKVFSRREINGYVNVTFLYVSHGGRGPKEVRMNYVKDDTN